MISVTISSTYGVQALDIVQDDSDPVPPFLDALTKSFSFIMPEIEARFRPTWESLWTMLETFGTLFLESATMSVIKMI